MTDITMGDDLSTKITDLEMRLKSVEEKLESNKLDMTKELHALKVSIAELQEASAAGQPSGQPSVMAVNKRSCTISFAGYTGAPENLKGPSFAAILLFDHDSNELWQFRKYLGNRKAEGADYGALILGLEKAMEMGYAHVNVEGSSAYVVKQYGKPFQTSNKILRKLCVDTMELVKKFETFSIQLVSPGCNIGAIKAAQKAVRDLIDVDQVVEEKLI